MASPEDSLQAELDADESQDEILFKSGVYQIADRPSLVWKFLVIFGGVVLVLGLLFWAQISGLNLPDLSSIGGSLMTLLAIFLTVLGLGCLIAGIVYAFAFRRDPYEMQPIR